MRVDVTAAILLFVGTLAGAQVDPCEPHLSRLAQGPQGYRLRGNRCEGIYVQPVGSTALLVASFTEGFEDFDPKSSDKLYVEWPSFGQNVIHLRSYGLHEKLYYEMDAAVPSGGTSFLWSTDILYALHLSKSDIGVVGFTDAKIGAGTKTLYFPLRIHQTAKLRLVGQYELIVLPGSELQEVFVSLAKVGSNGDPQSFLFSDKPVGRGYYPAQRGIPIDIPKPIEAGIYYLELGAKSKNGSSATQQIWFYNAGGQR